MLTLYRYLFSDLRTQGLFFHDGSYITDSLELPWLNNAQFISCIPEGVYRIQWKETGHDVGPCYEVLNVPGRDGILIHPANSANELEGCIAPGQKYGDVQFHSTEALRRIHAIIGDISDLTILTIGK